MGTDSSPGAEDEKLFGFVPGVICSIKPSEYDVNWFVKISDGTGNSTLPGAVFSGGPRGGPAEQWWLLWVIGVACIFYMFD